jgi:hypothetical protein
MLFIVSETQLSEAFSVNIPKKTNPSIPHPLYFNSFFQMNSLSKLIRAC